MKYLVKNSMDDDEQVKAVCEALDVDNVTEMRKIKQMIPKLNKMVAGVMNGMRFHTQDDK